MSSDFCIKCDRELAVYCGPCMDAVRDEADKLRADLNVEDDDLTLAAKRWEAEYHRARADFIALADALGMVSRDDTGRIGMVASVEEAVYAAVEAVRKANKWDDVQESLDMACENPPPNCECPGCSYAREKGGAK